MLAFQVLFWGAVLGLVYIYLGYPAVLAAWARLRSRTHRREGIRPTLSILVVAHNEEARIGRRIENLLALDYPAGAVEIVIASDASTDETVALARQYAPRGVEVVAFDRHRGKAAVLSELIPRLRGEIVVLMDVRQTIATDALCRLVDNFADPAVGAVSGELMLLEGEEAGGTEGVGFYWRYEKFIRLRESLVDSAIGVTGALYAIRRALFEPIPEETILDDVLIPMQIARQGFRVLFEPAARATDRLAANPAAEYQRKVRTIAGNFQLLWRHPWLLNPRANRLWVQTLSHKALRLVSPALLALALLANLALLDSAFYRLTLALQLAFYGAATAGHIWPAVAKKLPLLSIPHAFCLLNWSTVAAFYRFLRGRQRVTWTVINEEVQQ